MIHPHGDINVGSGFSVCDPGLPNKAVVTRVSFTVRDDHLRRISSPDVTARDFRTWAGTVLAYRELRRQGVPGPGWGRARQAGAAVDAVAHQLGNIRTVARTSYVHPAVIDAWDAGTLPAARRVPDAATPPTRAEELAVIRILALADASAST